MAKYFPVLLFLAMLCLTSCSDNRQQIDETKRRGYQIIAALEQFCADKGQYPQSLAELVPKYFQEIPLPTWGIKKWKYEANASGFTLQVNETVSTGDGVSHWFRYMGEKDGWQFGD